MPDPIISAQGLGKLYRISSEPRAHSLSDRVGHAFGRLRSGPRDERHPVRELWALRECSFEVHRGEVLGVIGPNGAGKSTLLSVLARITTPTEGYAELHGRVSSLLEVGTGFHPELSGRDNVFLNGAILGMSRAETAAKFDEIVEFSGVGDFIDMPVKRYSSGMYIRLAFSVAAHLDPDILILDEVLTVGDRAFQEKCLARIHEIVDNGRAVVFVSHDVASVARLCNRGLVLNNGRVAFLGDTDEAVARYLSSTPLGGIDRHTGREGTGELRIETVAVTGERGAVTADQPVTIIVELRGTGEPVADGELRVVLSINSTLGGTYIALSTDFDPSHRLSAGKLASGATVTCLLDELPLKPGAYTISATLERAGGEIVDRVIDQAMFTVLPTDYFKTGIIVGDTHPAPMLVRHRWNVAAHADVEIANATR
jgi:lipopolysaccharide transport system ATP-binding protein